MKAIYDPVDIHWIDAAREGFVAEVE